MIGKIVDGYEGGIINFQSTATPEQKTALENEIRASPLVLQVYRDVIPDTIHDPGANKQ
jgi:hypothetical protein